VLRLILFFKTPQAVSWFSFLRKAVFGEVVAHPQENASQAEITTLCQLAILRNLSKLNKFRLYSSWNHRLKTNPARTF